MDYRCLGLSSGHEHVVFIFIQDDEKGKKRDSKGKIDKKPFVILYNIPRDTGDLFIPGSAQGK